MDSRHVGVILNNRSFVCCDVDSRMNDRWAEFYAGEVGLEDLYSKQRVGEDDVCLA